MQSLRTKISDLNWGWFAYVLLNIMLPLVVFLLVNMGLSQLAFVAIILSKWRVFAVQPRHWLANLRANTPDIITGFSFLGLMVYSQDVRFDLVWTLFYVLWLLYLKPKSSTVYVGAQALIAQFLGITALFLFADRIPEGLMIILAWFIAQTSARHYISSFEEPLIRVISFLWGLVVAQISWVLNRWLIVYELFGGEIAIPQASIIVTVIAYVGGSVYYLYKHDKLNKRYLRSYLISACAILILVLLTSQWSAVK